MEVGPVASSTCFHSGNAILDCTVCVYYVAGSLAPCPVCDRRIDGAAVARPTGGLSAAMQEKLTVPHAQQTHRQAVAASAAAATVPGGGGTKVYFRRARNKVEPSCQANRVDPNLASWEPLCRHGLAANLWARCGWQWLWFTLVEGGGGMRSLLAQAFLTKKEEGGTPSF
ncbi:hypothetical protein MRS44_002722 [Fusarium solani]|uniref:uncharacterized protein n=1 Tax=Fusarium solani TaxID=169388 RepID=UPI0032C47EC7|nr:hypothetical protein MRS44_002722 [Fusarium solani]